MYIFKEYAYFMGFNLIILAFIINDMGLKGKLTFINT